MLIPHILGGAMLLHAPQFFTQPETEDRRTIAEVQKVAAQIGLGLKALEPDLWIVIANDRAARDAYFADTTAFAARFHLGAEHDRLLADFDAPSMVSAGVHPLLLFLVRLHVERERGSKSPPSA